MPQIFDPLGGLNSFVRQIPIPTLNSYIVLSVLLTSGSVYYVNTLFSDPEFYNSVLKEIRNETAGRFTNFNDIFESSLPVMQLFYVMIHPTLVWVLVNTMCAALAILGKIAVYLTFGELGMQESTMLRDRLCNFLLYKAVFLFGVLNSVLLEEFVSWIVWFALVSTVHLLQTIVIHRFEFFTSAVPSRAAQFRVLALNSLLTVLSMMLTAFALFSFGFLSPSYSLFIFADALKLLIRGLFLTAKSAVLVDDMLSFFASSVNAVSVTYYIDLAHDLITDAVDLLHYTHMLLYSQIVLSMACIVISMQLRSIYKSLTSRINRHFKHQRISAHIRQHYPEASRDELEAMEDWCAICWESMQCARRLPCNHFFHEWCLRAWLEQDSSCPTCRLVLSSAASAGNAPLSPVPANVPQSFNHFFRFDGGRYARWLPSFSVELSHNVGPNFFQRTRMSELDNSQLNSMAEQVREMFPQLDLGMIINDIRETGSTQTTIENILEGRIPDQPDDVGIPPLHPIREDDSSSESAGPSGSSAGFSRAVSSDSVGSSPDWVLPLELSPMNSSSGSRFSAHSDERHDILSHRKTALVEHHRRRYVASARGVDLRSGNVGESSESGEPSGEQRFLKTSSLRSQYFSL